MNSIPAQEAIFAHFLSTWPTFNETNPCLTWLARRYRLAIISNVDDQLLSDTIKRFAVSFDVLVTSERTKSYKPNKVIFDRVIELTGEDPRSIIHIAEARCEATPVRALDMGSIWVNRSPRSDEGSNAQPNAVVANLTQMIEAIA